MNSNMREGQLKQLQSEIQKYWSRLTDEDLQAIADDRAQLENKLQEEYSYTRKQARAEVNKFLNKMETRAENVRDTVEARVEQAQERLQEEMERAKDRAEPAATDYNRQVSEVAPPEVEQAVEQYPWLVVISAFVAGLLIGVMLNPIKK